MKLKEDQLSEEQAKTAVQCGSCDTLFHLWCINMKISTKDYTCLECRLYKQTITDHELFSFHEELKQFYR